MLKLDKTALLFNRNPQIGLTVGRYGGQGFTTAALSARHQQQRCVGCMAIVQQVGVHGQEGGGVWGSAENRAGMVEAVKNWVCKS